MLQKNLLNKSKLIYFNNIDSQIVAYIEKYKYSKTSLNNNYSQMEEYLKNHMYYYKYYIYMQILFHNF